MNSQHIVVWYLRDDHKNRVGHLKMQYNLKIAEIFRM